MTLEFYKILHIVGIIAVFGSLFAVLALSNSESGLSKKSKSLYFALHGIGLLIVLIAGFGMLARMQMMTMSEWPLWVWIKLGIWLLLGAAIVIAKKRAHLEGALILFFISIAMTAATLAIIKPF